MGYVCQYVDDTADMVTAEDNRALSTNCSLVVKEMSK